MINKEPVYIQINKALRMLIIKESYSAGDKFLTERSICDMYKVSRSTANKSLSSLVSENILEFKKGIGTFIKSVPDLNISYSRFSDPIEILRSRQIEFTVQLLKQNVRVGEKLTLIRRMVLSHAVFAVEMIYYPKELSQLFAGNKQNESIISLLKENSFLNVLETKDSLKTKISSEAERDLFKTPHIIPLIEIKSRSEIVQGNAVLEMETLYNGEIFSLEFRNQSAAVNFKIILEDSNNYHYIK